MPGAGACVAVAVLLLIAAALLVTAVARPAWLLVQVGAWGVVAVLALRGVFGFFEARVRPSVRSTPYHRWNLALYSPLCLLLALSAALSLA